MKKTSLISFMLLALSIHATAQAQAQAQEHRLAFSQAQQVEVFVDQAGDNNWCKDELALRFAFSLEQANLSAVENLLPKLGVLLSQQCPVAEKVTWQALNKDKKIQASGTANKQAAWLMNQQHTESVSQVAAAPVAAQAVEAAPTEVEAPAKPEQAAVPVVAANAPAPVINQPAMQEESAVAASAAVEASIKQTAPVTAAIEKNTEVEPVKTEVPAPVVAAKSAVVDLFSVNGWQPKDSRELLANNKAFRILVDQQGCKGFVQADANLGQQEFTVTSTGTTCENGFLNGKGRIAITRSDGARITEFDGFFKHGLPLDQEVNLPIVDVDEHGQIYLLLGKDVTNKSYYLLRAQKSYRGYWSINSGTVYLLTDDKDTFRQAESIKAAVLFPVAAMAKSFSRNSSYTLAAMTDFTEGVVNRNGDSWLYEVSVRKPQRNSPEWTFNPNNATNYLFRNEARAAREAQQIAEREAREAQRVAERKAYEERLELERVARQATRELSTYENYQENHRNLPSLVDSKLTNVSYSKVGYSSYQSLLKGKEANFSQIVKISGEKKDLFWADYPYNLAVDVLDTDVDLSKGWYLISGKQKIDAELKDDQGLPLTIVYPTYTFACKEKGCTDFFTPLNLTRLEFGKPDWTPEIAEQQIADAQRVQ